MCYNLDNQEFLYYKAPQEAAPGNVSKSAQNFKWPLKEALSMRFSPTIVHHALDQAHYLTDKSELWIPYVAFVSQNFGHLLWDGKSRVT